MEENLTYLWSNVWGAVHILVHEVYGLDNIGNAPYNPENARKYHTSTKELADLANKVNPKLLVLYHVQNYSNNPNALVEEIQRFGFKGRVIEARDRDIY